MLGIKRIDINCETSVALAEMEKKIHPLAQQSQEPTAIKSMSCLGGVVVMCC